jgi:hypothetical protein
VFLEFVDNCLAFLSIRENSELFSYMNEFYNLILKSIYLMSLQYKSKAYHHYIKHIKNYNGGRINGLVPMRAKPFDKISKG